VGRFSIKGAKTLYDAALGSVITNSTILKGRASVAQNEAEEARELLVVVKSVPASGDAGDVSMARREIRLFDKLGSRHPNLLPILFAAETELELVVVAPYAPSGDLHKLCCVAGGTFKCLEEAEAGALALQLLAGLAALHDARCLHGDMKLQNVFLTEVNGRFVAQIGDFGLSRFVPLGAKGVKSEGGTPGYMPPEMVGLDEMVSFSADLFALGVMMYQLLSSMSPFEPVSNVDAPLEFDEACWDPILPSATDFVRVLLAKTPEERGTAESNACHPWLSSADSVPHGKPRLIYAPQPDVRIRFHTPARPKDSPLVPSHGHAQLRGG
jgi:serine/threonine protein kinase